MVRPHGFGRWIDSHAMIDAMDWTAVAHLCAGLPLGRLLDAIDGQLPEAAPVEVWLWDYQQRALNEVRSNRSGTLTEVLRGSDPALVRQLRVHGDHLGLLLLGDGLLNGGGELAVDTRSIDGLTDVVAIAIRANTMVGDEVATVRRSAEMSLPAEMQWTLLPPEQFSTPEVTVAAAVEPAYETGGDVFDYALRGDRLFLAVLDARGHGLRAATLSTVAAGAMRRARRQGADLVQIGTEIGDSIQALGDEREFVSAVLLDIDVTTGVGHWLSAGHPPPLLVGEEVEALELRPTLPLGMVINGRASELVPQPFTLGADQHLILYSDGVVDNAALDDGTAIGDIRFRRALLERLGDAGGGAIHIARGVIEDLLTLTGPKLRDDATLMIVALPAASGAPLGDD